MSNNIVSHKILAKDIFDRKKDLKLDVTLPLFLDSTNLVVQIFHLGGLLGLSQDLVGFASKPIDSIYGGECEIEFMEMNKRRGIIRSTTTTSFEEKNVFQDEKTEKEIIRNVIGVKTFITKKDASLESSGQTLSYVHFNGNRFEQLNKVDLVVFSRDSGSYVSMKKEEEALSDVKIVPHEHTEFYKVWYALRDPTKLLKEEFVCLDFIPSAPPVLPDDIYGDIDSLPSAPVFEEFNNLV